ncbi:hypothetical protein [Solidesulfovibrio sp.]|uniref:hypothetical protein n=1 Tax=Solidesulfovibrio sp. TaxID=2910990 RepID=UPI002B2156C7|nr:hypothetical protein [Solidesulfovibrio sp.]MEA4858297.1 hypothetical protein [Solidesulfovibrio sp.]
MGREQAGFVAMLERLWLLKYVLATVFTGTVFALTAGAYCYEELSRRPPRLPRPSPELLELAEAPGHALRAPVSRLVRFAAAPQIPAGFSFYDIGAGETPQSLARKLGRKRFRLLPGRGEACDFAAPLTVAAGGREAVAAFIRERSRRCCAVAGPVPGQLATYAFSRDSGAARNQAATDGPVSGSAVFSGVDGGLLTLDLRFAQNIEGYRAALEKHLTERFGPSSPMAGDGAAWARDGGLVTMVRAGNALAVTAYFAANIDRHAAAAGRLADRPAPRQPDPAARRLALADRP